MPTRIFTLILALLLPVNLDAETPVSPETPPGVILLLADDLGWGDVGFNGSKVVKTPALDAMARNGLRLERFYAAAPVCSPTRGSALTGRHPFRYGIFSANVGHLPERERTLAEILKEAGYATGFFGKWHLGTFTTRRKDSNRGRPGQTEHFTTPSDHGFDVTFATEAKVPTYDPMHRPGEFEKGESLRYGWKALARSPDGGIPGDARPYGTHYWRGKEELVPVDSPLLRGDDSRVIVDQALPFIEKAVTDGKPFLAVIWFHTPHLPVVASARHRELFRHLSPPEQLYFGSIAAMDEQVGRLRERLRELGVERDTLVWFSSDNGPERGTPGSAGPLRARKRSLFEGGIRVPTVLEWPARIVGPRSSSVPGVSSDILPTILEMLGLEKPRLPLDGVSLLPVLRDDAKERPSPIFFQTRSQLALSGNRYKLVVERGENRSRLFDLREDPAEAHDLAAEMPERVEALRKQLDEWVQSCEASLRELEGSPRKRP